MASLFGLSDPELQGSRRSEESECLEREECNVCKFKKFGRIVSRMYDIPSEDVEHFARSIEEHERSYLRSSEVVVASYNLKYDFHRISQYLSSKGLADFLTLGAIKNHFQSCAFDGLRNRTVLHIHKLDEHIRAGLNPEMFYTTDENGNFGFNSQNVHSLKDLFTMKRTEILNLRTLDKIL